MSGPGTQGCHLTGKRMRSRSSLPLTHERTLDAGTVPAVTTMSRYPDIRHRRRRGEEEEGITRWNIGELRKHQTLWHSRKALEGKWDKYLYRNCDYWYLFFHILWVVAWYFSQVKIRSNRMVFWKHFIEVWKKVPSEIKEVFLRQLGIKHKLV